jgi:prevent-host-death family protein
MDVAIRDLRARLSSYVKRASARELITVTDGGRPVAVLGPELRVVDQVAVGAGWLTPASAPGLRAVRRYQSDSTVEQVLADDRAE